MVLKRAPASPKSPSPELDFRAWILFEDDGIIAVNKPAGVLSQGGEGGELNNLVYLARVYTGRDGIGVLHRIDRNVSGVVLLAKLPRMASAMTKLITKGKLSRLYRAVTAGVPRETHYLWDAWLAKDERTNEVRARSKEELSRMTEHERVSFRPASTEGVVRETFTAPLGPCASFDVRPITGRSHQIRVHLSHAGFPIVGDPKYGVMAKGVNRPLLHAVAVEFRHPMTQKPVRIEAPLPWEESWLRRLGSAR